MRQSPQSRFPFLQGIDFEWDEGKGRPFFHCLCHSRESGNLGILTLLDYSLRGSDNLAEFFRSLLRGKQGVW
jgi:hypothetical protein